MKPINASRRRFLKLAGVTGGGLVMGVSLTGCSAPPITSGKKISPMLVSRPAAETKGLPTKG